MTFLKEIAGESAIIICTFIKICPFLEVNIVIGCRHNIFILTLWVGAHSLFLAWSGKSKQDSIGLMSVQSYSVVIVGVKDL